MEREALRSVSGKLHRKDAVQQCEHGSAGFGHYEDDVRRIGFATVVPAARWRTSNAFTMDNAEYVVLLYGAVWAAPRRTFAAVLERPLNGVGAFSFSW
jgi:hypothetical protein